MPLKPYVSSMAYIPRAMLSRKERIALKSELTISVSPNANYGNTETLELKCYDTSVKGYLGLPRHFGLERYPDLDFADKTVTGDKYAWVYKGISAIKPRTEAQAEYFAKLANICKSDGYRDFVAVAKTGSGKTVATINAAILTKRPILVLVHTNSLKELWLGSVTLKNGRYRCLSRICHR